MQPVALSAGGLVLYRAPAGAAPLVGLGGAGTTLVANGRNAVAFSGPGAHGTVSLSQTHVLGGQNTPVFAEIKVVADAAREGLHAMAGSGKILYASWLDLRGKGTTLYGAISRDAASTSSAAWPAATR